MKSSVKFVDVYKHSEMDMDLLVIDTIESDLTLIFCVYIDINSVAASHICIWEQLSLGHSDTIYAYICI